MALITAVSLCGFGGMFGFPAISDAAAFSIRSASSCNRESTEISGCPSFSKRKPTAVCSH
nr:hypothetical protein [Escherichia coli]